MEQTDQVLGKVKKSFRIHRWIWIVAIFAVLAVAANALLVVSSNKAADRLTKKKDTSEEIKIKQYASSLRGSIVRFFETNKTYVGWNVDKTTQAEIKKIGSELKTQALSKDTYLIYAKMPSSKLIFCMDNNFTGEITNLMPWQKTCK